LIALDSTDAPAPTPLSLAAVSLAPESLAPESGPALAADEDERSYFLLSGGLVTTRSSDGSDANEEIDFDEGWSLAVAYGNEFHVSLDGDTRWAWELEGTYSDQDVDDQGPTQAVRDVTTAGIFGNLVGEWALGESVGIYAGAGVGAAWLEVGDNGDALSDFEEEDGPFLAWQGKVGLHLARGSATSWRIGYRFVNIDDVELDESDGDSSFELETQQHVLELTLHLRL